MRIERNTQCVCVYFRGFAFLEICVKLVDIYDISRHLILSRVWSKLAVEFELASPAY